MRSDRRSVLKALALTPGTLLASSTLLTTGCSNGTVDIYLFGLFLMEFQRNNLVLVTPQYECHKYCVVYSNGPADMPEYATYWDRLKQGKVSAFSPENLKFPANAIRESGFVLDPANPAKHKHRCTMVLPKPESIEVKRLEDASNFHPCQKSSIGALIKKEAGAQLGSVTHLQYQSIDGSSWTEFYAVIHDPLTLDTVNGALKAARYACGGSPYGDRFDLQMDKLKALEQTGSNGKRAECPTAKDLFDMLTPRDAGRKLSQLDVDIASCPQFGIHG